MISPSARSRTAEAIHAVVDVYLADGSVPGVAVAVVDAHGLIVEHVAGWQDLGSHRAVAPDTLFEIGSIGKTFTAAVIMQLAEEGRLDLMDPVARHLPWFAVPGTGREITIHHLLSHTAGITAGVDHTPEATFQVWRLRSQEPGHAPGRGFHYSNVGYKALGLVVEAIEAEPYPDVVRRRILEPLGMVATEPAITNDVRSRLAVGYEPARDERAFMPGDPLAPATWLATDTADGAIATTAAELGVFLRMLIRSGEGTTGRILRRASVERMATPIEAENAQGYGYGLRVIALDDAVYIGHGGGMVGYRAGLQWDPAAGIGAVVLQNGPGRDPVHLARLAIRVAVASMRGHDPSAVRVKRQEPSRRTTGPARDHHVPAAQLAAITGVYRSHNPWTPVFNVIADDGVAWLVFPSAPNGFAGAQPLIPVRRGYRVGPDPLGPEHLRFDTVIEGRARRAWLSGWEYYRVADQAVEGLTAAHVLK